MSADLSVVLRTKVELPPNTDPVKWAIFKPRLARLLTWMANPWAVSSTEDQDR